MSEPTPPPERPLSRAARARIRAELVQHAHENPSTTPRWLVPAGAAAAVALVAGLAYWAVSAGGSGPDAVPVTGGGTTSASATSGTTQPSDPVPSTVVNTTETLPSPPTEPGDGGSQVGTGTCRTELVNVLKGAQEAFEAAPDLSFWVKGDQFTLCYQLDGSTTVTHPLPLANPVEEVGTYRVASLYPPTADGYRTVRVAGGVVPEGARDFGVEYTFPDGHTEDAHVATDASGRQWWWMVSSYDDGGGNESKLPEIKVTSSHDDFDYGFQLQWGVDTCAQANHGC